MERITFSLTIKMSYFWNIKLWKTCHVLHNFQRRYVFMHISLLVLFYFYPPQKVLNPKKNLFANWWKNKRFGRRSENKKPQTCRWLPALAACTQQIYLKIFILWAVEVITWLQAAPFLPASLDTFKKKKNRKKLAALQLKTRHIEEFWGYIVFLSKAKCVSTIHFKLDGRCVDTSLPASRTWAVASLALPYHKVGQAAALQPAAKPGDKIQIGQPNQQEVFL